MPDARLWACGECDAVLAYTDHPDPFEEARECPTCGADGRHWRHVGNVDR